MYAFHSPWVFGRGLDRFAASADASIMTKHQPKKLPRDVNSRANAIGKIATGETVLPEESAMATGGRKGGAKGGKARAGPPDLAVHPSHAGQRFGSRLVN
jgi:hypothetical protein